MKKKFLPLAFIIIGASTLGLTTSLKETSNSSNRPSVVLADYQLEEYKAQKKDELNECVDLDSCPQEIKQDIEYLLEYGLSDIDDATSEEEVDEIFVFVTQRISEMLAEFEDPEARELEKYKQSKIDYIDDNFDLDRYPENKKEYYRHMYDECVANITYADTSRLVDYYFFQFLRNVDINVPDIPEAETLEQAKEYALEEIDRTLDSYPLREYFKQELNFLVAKSKKAIDEATRIDEVNNAINDFRNEFKEFPTNEDVSINKFRRDLIDAYIAYEFERIELTGFDDKDDVLPEMDEKFEKDMKAARTLEELLSCYEYAIEGLNELMPLRDDQIHGGTSDADNKEGTKNNIGLIVACAVEGAVIVAGATTILVITLKKKKQRTSNR